MDVDALRLEVPRAVASCILGLHGAAKRELEAATGASVQVHVAEGRLELAGKAAAVQAAQQLLAERVCYVAYEVPREIASAVLGERGQTRQELEKASGAHIWVELRDSGLSFVQLAGSGVSVAQATSALDARFFQDSIDLPLFAERRGKEIVRQLRETIAREGRSQDCRLHLERMPNHCCVKFTGSREIVAKAKSLVEGAIAFTELAVSKAEALQVIGKGGSRIKLLREKTGAHLEVVLDRDPCLVQIAGSPQALSLAKEELRADAPGASPAPSTGDKSVRMPTAVAMDTTEAVIASPAQNSTSAVQQLASTPKHQKVLIDGLDVLRFRNASGSGAAPEVSWPQLFSAAAFFALKAHEIQIFLPLAELDPQQCDRLRATFGTEAVVKADASRSLILSAAEVLTSTGKRCVIVSNATGGAFDDAWVQDLRVGYAFLDADTFVPAWPSAAPAMAEKTAKGFFHKRSMFVGGIMEKKERCIDCTRPVWDGHASMKCSKCRTPGGAGPKLHIDAEAAKRVILHTTGVPEPKLSQDAAASNPVISSDSEDKKDGASKPIKADKKEKKLKKLKKVKKEKKDKKKKKKDKDDTSS
ncbi:Hdlbp [Symbiodinium sp. CCMP2456]|nr:Hdlbp [Symbiodinium sp. CCMP2456]